MAKRRNERLKITENKCPICGKVKGLLISKKPRFKAGVAYNDGPCDTCKHQWEKMINQLANGGILLICKQCNSISTVMGVPKVFEPFIDQMPDGSKRLELPYCNNCKEANDGTEDQTQGAPDRAQI